MRSIRSRDNPLFRDLAKLAGSTRKRGRRGQTFLDGVHLLTAYLDAGMMPRQVLLNSAALQDAEINSTLQRLDQVPVALLDDRLLADLSELKSSTGILAVIDVPKSKMSVGQSRFALLLEDIQDPGNMGSMFRSAAAAGCDAVFLSSGCADAWSPRVLRGSMGGHFSLQIHENQNLPEVAKLFPGAKLATILQSACSLYDLDLNGNVAFMVGNEGAGLSAELLDCATMTVTIPMIGHVGSLNAAAAVAICLFEAVRQRKSRH
jgi:TrmH family RNA methyltransferase